MSSDSHMPATNAVVDLSAHKFLHEAKLQRQATLVKQGEVLNTFIANVSETKPMSELIAELAHRDCPALRLIGEIFQMPNISLKIVIPYKDVLDIVSFCVNRPERNDGLHFLVNKFTEFMDGTHAIDIQKLKIATEYAFKVGMMIDAMGSLYFKHQAGTYIVFDPSTTSIKATQYLNGTPHLQDLRLIRGVKQPKLKSHPFPKRVVLRFSQSKPGCLAYTYTDSMGEISHSLIIYRFDLPAGKRGWTVIENDTPNHNVYPTMTEFLNSCTSFDTIYPNYPVENLYHCQFCNIESCLCCQCCGSQGQCEHRHRCCHICGKQSQCDHY